VPFIETDASYSRNVNLPFLTAARFLMKYSLIKELRKEKKMSQIRKNMPQVDLRTPFF